MCVSIACSYSLKSKLFVRYCLVSEMWEAFKIRVVNVSSYVSTLNIFLGKGIILQPPGHIFLSSVLKISYREPEVCFFEPCFEHTSIYLLFLSSNNSVFCVITCLMF
jgi:hypothetical protein